MSEMAKKRTIEPDHICIMEDEIDDMKSVMMSLKNVPKDVSDIKNELLGTEYTQNKGLIHQTAENSERIAQLREQYNLDRMKVLGFAAGVSIIISIVYELLFK